MSRRPAPLAALAPVAAVLVLIVLCFVACGGSAGDTPEKLFETVKARALAGEDAKIWDLYTEEERLRQMKGIDDARVTLRKNPGAHNLLRQFHCTMDEFERLSYVELFVRMNRGWERALEDTVISDKQPDPRKPDEVVLSISRGGAVQFLFRAKQVGSEWQLVGIQPVLR
jgi:hypothetical protein